MSRLTAETFPRNLSRLDRGLRLALGLLLLVLPATGALHGLGATSAYLFAWVPLFTAAIGWCPLYTLFGIRTRSQ
jgi:hypothetical protein